MSRLIQLANNAVTTLSVAISATDVSATGVDASLFPTISGTQYFFITFENSAGNREICKVTALAGNVFTIVRAQDGTAARAWASGDTIQLRLTEEVLNRFTGEGVQLYPRAGTPPTPTADQGFLTPYANDELVTLLAGADPSMDLGIVDEAGLFVRPGDGYGALPDAAVDLSGLAIPKVPRSVTMTPTATRIVTLPTTKVPIGWRITVHNLATAFYIQVNASGGGGITLVAPSSFLTFECVSKVPTTAAGWRVVDGLNRFALTDAAQDFSTVPASGPVLELLMTPTAARTITLPTTNVPVGFRIQLSNVATTAGLNLVVNSSGGNRVWLVCPQNHCELKALQAAPTTAAHWGVADPGWPIHARVHKSADQTPFTEGSAATAVTFDTVLRDPAGMFDNATDSFLLPALGWYEVRGRVAFSGDTGFQVNASFYLNGAAVAGSDEPVDTPDSTAAISRPLAVACVQCTNPGVDAVTFRPYYTAAGVNIGDISATSGLTAAKITWMEARWIGP